MLTRTQALAKLKPLVSPDSEPKLSDDKLLACLDATARAKVWAPNTEYAFGERVVTGNGRVYKCRQAGTSGATLNTYGAGVTVWYWTDGTVAWDDAGPAHAEIYDVRGAAHEAWLRKAAKASEQTSFSSDGKRFELDQLFRHCAKMANRYLPVVVA